MNLKLARQLIHDALEKGRSLELKPLAVIVLDSGGYPVAFDREDGASNLRYKMAHAKAFGALGLGMGSRGIFNRAEQQPYFVESLNTLADGAMLPVPGGVIVRTHENEILGAIGITGDTSDNDEACGIAAIEKAGLISDTGG